MIRLAHPVGYAAERKYAADVMLGELLGLEVACVEEERDDVELALPGHAGSLLLPDRLFATDPRDWLTERSLPTKPLERLDGVPLLFGGDFFGAAFFLLTRYEEAATEHRDEHGRFSASASLAAREGFLERPLVNEYAELLWRDLHATWPRLERRHRAFRVLPSHDVDFPFGERSGLVARARNAAGDVVKRQDPTLAARRLAGASDLYDTFDFIMDTSERSGVRSTFFFLAAHGPENRIGAGYSLDDPRIRSLLRRIHARGHELGLHGSYASYDEPSRLRAELSDLQAACAQEGIEQDAWGGRQHFLRWSGSLWAAYEEAGLAYDSSLSFADHPGFRAGICCEYPVFDLWQRRPLGLRERPLVAMEVSLLQYLRLGDAAALDRLTALKETCRRFEGDFTLLWHNDRLASRGSRRVYSGALAA
jgi:hypothetical protein